MTWASLPVCAALLALSLAPVTVGQAAPATIQPTSAPDGALGSFSALGTGVNGGVDALASEDDTVYVGGDFTSASGVAGTNRIAAWSLIDDTWSALGSGMADNQVYSVAVASDGTVYAAGTFSLASGVTDTSRVAAWSDDTWSALGSGISGGSVYTMTIAADDTVFAGGFFGAASGVTGASTIAAWSDDTWSALGTGIPNGPGNNILALALGDDTIYAAGPLTNVLGVAGTNRIAAWADDTWSALGAGVNGNSVDAVATAADGTLFVGGDFTDASGVAGTSRVAAWADDTWSALGAGMNDVVYALAIDDSRELVYAGGDFLQTGDGSTNLRRVGVWDVGISEWIPLAYASGHGLSAPVRALAVDDSVVYVGGLFVNAGGDSAADRIAKWTWQPPQGSNTLDTTVGASVTLTGEGFIGVPATGGVKVGSTVATYTRDDSATITMTVPAGSFTNAPITVDGVGGWGQVGVLSVPAPPEPSRAVPAGPPTDVIGVAGDSSASVRWAAPASMGSFPVTNYQLMSTPSGGMCLTTTLTCEVRGLANGTDYSFTVRALTGAGWSSWSTQSEVVTPQRPVDPSILITGSRGEVRGSPGIIVSGTATGLGMGAVLTPWMRFDDQARYTEGRARILVDASGDFTWQRRTQKTIHVQLRTPDGELTSNTLTIRPR